MIKMTYDPVMGVRYLITDDIPCAHTDATRAIMAKIDEQFYRTRHIRAKQLRRNNTKHK